MVSSLERTSQYQVSLLLLKLQKHWNSTANNNVNAFSTFKHGHVIIKAEDLTTITVCFVRLLVPNLLPSDFSTCDLSYIIRWIKFCFTRVSVQSHVDFPT